MGKTPKPLFIIAYHPVCGWSELTDLESQGHTIIRIEDCGQGEHIPCIPEADLVLGPTCWLMDEQHRKYLDLAIAEARRRRYPPTKKEGA